MNNATIHTAAQTIEERGKALYEQHLRPVLEPAESGKAVAIHLDSGDYIVHRKWASAMRELRQRYPDGERYVQFVGPAIPFDESYLALLAARNRKP